MLISAAMTFKHPIKFLCQQNQASSTITERNLTHDVDDHHLTCCRYSSDRICHRAAGPPSRQLCTLLIAIVTVRN